MALMVVFGFWCLAVVATAWMSWVTVLWSFDFSALMLMTVSSSWAPSFTSFCASLAFVSVSVAPSGNPTVLQSFTFEFLSMWWASGTWYGLTTAQQNSYFFASVHSLMTSFLVAVGLISVESMMWASSRLDSSSLGGFVCFCSLEG